MPLRTPRGTNLQGTLVRLALTALACGVALAACGSSSNTSTTASNADPALKFAQCMRSHGVSNFPDPTAQGEIAVNPSEVQSPAFQTAQQVCQKFLPKKGPHLKMTASEHQAAVRFAACMRTHGQPDFPDPLSAGESSGRTLVLNGMLFPIGAGLDPRSPAFRQATGRCGIKPPPGPPPGGPD